MVTRSGLNIGVGLTVRRFGLFEGAGLWHIGNRLWTQRRLRQHGSDLGAVKIAGGEQSGGKRVQCVPIPAEDFQRHRIGAIDGGPDGGAELVEHQEVAIADVAGKAQQAEAAKTEVGFQARRQARSAG